MPLNKEEMKVLLALELGLEFAETALAEGECDPMNKIHSSRLALLKNDVAQMLEAIAIVEGWGGLS